MKKITLLSFLFAVILHFNSAAQKGSTEKFGQTFNLGLGVGYYHYTNHSMPVLHFNYEFDVAKDFTLAPFITIYSYSHSYYWAMHIIPISITPITKL